MTLKCTKLGVTTQVSGVECFAGPFGVLTVTVSVIMLRLSCLICLQTIYGDRFRWITYVDGEGLRELCSRKSRYTRNRWAYLLLCRKAATVYHCLSHSIFVAISGSVGL